MPNFPYLICIRTVCLTQFGHKVDWVSFGKKNPLQIVKNIHIFDNNRHSTEDVCARMNKPQTGIGMCKYVENIWEGTITLLGINIQVILCYSELFLNSKLAAIQKQLTP